MKKIIYLHLIFFFILKSGYTQYTQNYAAGFNGANSYVAVPSHSELQPATAITLEAWIYPTSLPSTSACIVGKNYLTSFYFGIENSGRFIFIPRNQPGGFLRSRVTGTVKVNQWNHIAGTYDGTTTRLYLNGTLDTSRTGINGAVGSNSDSLYIGCDRAGGTTPFYFFTGRLDNVRIWKSARTSTEISNNMFIPLNMYQLSGSYSFLSASYQFDNSTEDISGPTQNDGFVRNVTYINYNNKTVNHIDYNNNLSFNGSTDYCSHYNIGDPVTPSTALTLECWIKRDTTSSPTNDRYIINKSKTISQFDYFLQLYNSGALIFGINNGSNILFTSPLITNAQWTHIAASYSSVTGSAAIYINGELKASGTFSGNPLINNSGNDSLYIAGKAGTTSSSANRFRGQIDEVRIWRKSRTQQEIKEFMHKRPPYPASLNDSLIIFDFDNLHSGFQIGATNYNYGLKYIGSASLTSAHTNTPLTSSPMLSDAENSIFSSSFTSSYRRFFIPDGNIPGITDSIYINGVGAVNNLRVYLMMTHTQTQDLILSLTSPSGTTINLLNVKGGNKNDIMTIFSDNADSIASSGSALLPAFGITPSFSPSVKPDQVLSSFNGEGRNGLWKLKCVDLAGGDIGYVHGWGINLLSYKTLNVTALIQGFYDASSNKMKADTAVIYFRIPLPPYPLVDSSKAVLDSNGNAVFYFNKINNGYRVFRHRNSIETWSPGPIPFIGDSSSYNFTDASSKAYGNNMIQIDSAPVKFAIYNGDVNQNGAVDLDDVIQVYNDANVFASGYIVTDVTGNYIADLSDVLLAFNNSNLFVSVMKP
ncbi:MAG TPA: proprotein convertase P-domain-containing protein [Ignavibacteria bacterium]|nr:proprotein convertase P-domain-containing protein [Ignavibacteria bacterium]